MAKKEYDNTNRGTLFVNTRIENEKDPDLTGPANFEGIDHWFDAWIDKGREKIAIQARPKGDAKTSIKKGQIKKVDKEGKSENYPDWKGWIENQEKTKSWWVSAWRRMYEDKQTGEEKALLSVSFELKEPRQESNRQESESSSDHEPAF